MTSPGYPVFQSNVICQRNLISPAGTYIRVWMNDLGMGEVDSNGKWVKVKLNVVYELKGHKPFFYSLCSGAGYLQVVSACSGIRYCGQKPPSSSHGVYIFTSCTNTFQLTYSSANPELINLRGFNMYYEGKLVNLNSWNSIRGQQTIFHYSSYYSRYRISYKFKGRLRG